MLQPKHHNYQLKFCVFRGCLHLIKLDVQYFMLKITVETPQNYSSDFLLYQPVLSPIYFLGGVVVSLVDIVTNLIANEKKLDRPQFNWLLEHGLLSLMLTAILFSVLRFICLRLFSFFTGF